MNGILKNASATRDSPGLAELREENMSLLQRIKDLESKTDMMQNKDRYIPTDAQAYLNSNKFTIYNISRDSDIMDTFPQELTVPELSYEQTKAIVQFSLEYLSFIHCAIHSTDFYTMYHRLGINNCLSRGDYLDCSIWYGLLCSGIYFADCDQLESWGIDFISAKEYPGIYLRASLECLHRAEYMKYPDIRTVQAFCVLSLSFNQLNSRYLQDCLSLTAIYVCQTLGLDNIKDEEDEGNQERSTTLDKEVCRRIWWTVVIIDWLRVGNGRTMIGPGTFATQLPSNLETTTSKQVLPLNTLTPVSYLIAMARVSKIRRCPKDSISTLQEYDKQLLSLLDSLPNELKFSEHPYFSDSSTSSFQRFLITIVTAHERLLINLRVLSFASQSDWNLIHKPVCIDCAQLIIRVCCMEAPKIFKKAWVVPGNGVPSAILLLIYTTRYNDEIFQVFIPLLEDLSKVNGVAARGFRLLQHIQRMGNTNRIQDILKDWNQLSDFATLPHDPDIGFNGLLDFDADFWDQIIQNFS